MKQRGHQPGRRPGTAGERPARQPAPARGEPAPARGEPAPARGEPGSARDRLAEHLAAARRASRHRAFVAVCGALSALVLLLAGTSWALASYINDAVKRVNAGTAGGSSGPLNVLVAGVDLRTGLTRAQERQLHVGHDVSSNSDTMMLVHVSADRSRVTVVSLPRDSWVDIPGHGMNKINAAFGLGGPKLMVATVEHATGLTINHYVEVNFLGFVKVIDALGGVNICLPRAVHDRYSGLRMSAGVHHVNGITALRYARDRHSFAASDLARIDHQQSLLSSLLREAISSRTMTDPLRLSQFLRATLSVIKVDQSMNVTALADQLRGITLGDVRFLTVPLASTNYLTPTGESAVLWDNTTARALFSRLKADQPLTGAIPRRSHHPHAGHTAHQHSSGGTTSPGAGSRTASQDACR